MFWRAVQLYQADLWTANDAERRYFNAMQVRKPAAETCVLRAEWDSASESVRKTRDNLRNDGRALAKKLETDGHDATKLLKFINTLYDDEATTIDIRRDLLAQLQRIEIQSEVRPDGVQRRAEAGQATRKPGRPKGSKTPDDLDRFIKREAKALKDSCSRIPVKELIDKYKNETERIVTNGTMRGRMRDALGRRS